MNRNLLLTLAALVLGCSPALSTMQPAGVLAKGQFHTATAVGVPLPAGAALDIIQDVQAVQGKRSARPASVKNTSLLAKKYAGMYRGLPRRQGARAPLAGSPRLAFNPNGDDRGVLTSFLAATLYPPIPLAEQAVRVGLGRGTDLGVRFTAEAIGVEGKWQFLKSKKENGWAGSLGLGINQHFFRSNLYQDTRELSLVDLNVQQLRNIALDEFNRVDVSVPVLFGRKHTAVQYWFGPKYMFSSYNFKSNLGGLIDEEGKMHFLGGTAGIALGYKSFWFVTEITALNLFLREDVLGEEQNLGGLLVYPAFGFMARF